MLNLLRTLVRLLLVDRPAIAVENLALRQQLAVALRRYPRPALRKRDRLFWVLLSNLRTEWRSALVVVKPDTVVRWHRRGFRLYWRWKSRRCDGRPGVPRDVRDLIRHMAEANPLWGAPRIHGELLRLGIEVAQASVAKYMPRRRKPPSPTWRSFLDNHVKQIAACNFLAVHTATFGILYVTFIRSSPSRLTRTTDDRDIATAASVRHHRRGSQQSGWSFWQAQGGEDEFYVFVGRAF